MSVNAGDVYCVWCRCWSLVMSLRVCVVDAIIYRGCDQHLTRDLFVCFSSITALLSQLYLAMSILMLSTLCTTMVSLPCVVCLCLSGASLSASTTVCPASCFIPFNWLLIVSEMTSSQNALMLRKLSHFRCTHLRPRLYAWILLKGVCFW